MLQGFRVRSLHLFTRYLLKSEIILYLEVLIGPSQSRKIWVGILDKWYGIRKVYRGWLKVDNFDEN